MPPISGVTVLKLDARNAESCWTFVAQAEGEHGRIDGLINNAGILLDHNTPVLDLSEDDLKRVLEVNLIAPIRLCQLVTGGMLSRGYGRIVNISSGLGAITDMGGVYPSYRISKLALNRFTPHPRRRTRPEEQCEGQQPRSRLGQNRHGRRWRHAGALGTGR